MSYSVFINDALACFDDDGTEVALENNRVNVKEEDYEHREEEEKDGLLGKKNVK